jgi:hypothetical protein
MPPGQIQTRWFQASFPGNPWLENREGHEGKPQPGLRYEV